MNDETRRKLTLLDLILLIAACAFGLTTLTHVHWVSWKNTGVMFGGPYDFSYYYSYVRVFLFDGVAVLLCLHAAVVVGSVTRRSGEWWKRTGFLFSVVALAAFGISFAKAVFSIQFVSLFHAFNYRLSEDDYFLAYKEATLSTAAAVSLTWLVLRLTGRGSPATTWTEVVGTSAGVAWIYIFFIPLP